MSLHCTAFRSSEAERKVSAGYELNRRVPDEISTSLSVQPSTKFDGLMRGVTRLNYTKSVARHRAALLHAGAPDGLGCLGATAGSGSLSPVGPLKIALAANHSYHDMPWHDYTIDKGCHTTLTYI